MFRVAYLIALFGAVSCAIANPITRSAATSGTVFTEPVSDSDWGRPVASGDLDGDGFEDLLVAASESYGGTYSKVYIMRGGPDAHRKGEVDLSVAGVDQVIIDAAPNANLGSSMTTGDVNGDGIDDLLVCASTASTGLAGAGIAYLIFGGPDFFELAIRDLADTANWDLRIQGPVAGGDMGGSSAFAGLDAQAAAIGDIDGDQYGDMILGVHLADGGGSESGRVYVVYGGPFPSGFTISLGTLPTGLGFRVEGAVEYDELGTFVLTADITGDGIEELILANEYFSHGPGYFATQGAVHIFRGRQRSSWDQQVYRLSLEAADITLLGNRNWDQLGAAAAVGDFNGDGIADLASSAPGAESGDWNNQTGEGFVYGLLGSAAYQSGLLTIDYATATPDFLIIGEPAQSLGGNLTAADFNRDGYDDIAASSRDWGDHTEGIAEVVFGRPFVGNPVFHANVDTDLQVVGSKPYEQVCDKIGSIDSNDDGIDELILATPFDSEGNGRVHVFSYMFEGACCLPDPPYCQVTLEADCLGVWSADQPACDASDCNSNEIPDACEVALDLAEDCDANDIPDECQICGDLDNDGDVDYQDYRSFRAAFGSVAGHPAFNACVDYDGSDAVGTLDFAQWLTCYRAFVGNPQAGPPVAPGLIERLPGNAGGSLSISRRVTSKGGEPVRNASPATEEDAE